MALVTSDPKYYHSDVVNYSKFKYVCSELPNIRIVFDTIDKITQTTLVASIQLNKIDNALKQKFIDVLKTKYHVTATGMHCKKFSDIHSGNIVAVIPLENIEFTIENKQVTIPERALFIPQSVVFKQTQGQNVAKFGIIFTK